MTEDLFIASPYNTSLEAFAAEFSEHLGCGPFEERDSSSYVDEHYFQCSALAVEIRVAVADLQGFDDFHFWVSVEPDGVELSQGLTLAGLIDGIARRLVLLGYRVVRLPDGGRIDGSVIHYRQEPPDASEQAGAIVTFTEPSP
jgi:hypothetical protein